MPGNYNSPILTSENVKVMVRRQRIRYTKYLKRFKTEPMVADTLRDRKRRLIFERCVPPG